MSIGSVWELGGTGEVREQRRAGKQKKSREAGEGKMRSKGDTVRQGKNKY